MMYLSLALSGFIAATLFPASSELLLVGLFQQGYTPWLLWLAATTGNTLGSGVNWAIGWEIGKFQHKRWFPVTPLQLESAQAQFLRYGIWSLLLAWLPLIGDPLTLVAGVLRVRFVVFVALVATGKSLRYAVLIFMADRVLQA